MKEDIQIKIDGNELQVKPGTTVLQAASALGISIPTMCHYEGLESHTSCMICLVKDRKNGALFPSCSMRVQDGMDIVSRDEEVDASRKMALELLLSEHVGDCQAPCQLACPAHMDIPLMNRLLEAGKYDEAYTVVMEDIPLPSVLGRICPAPCEKVCKRKDIDEPVSICLLKRFAGDEEVKRPKTPLSSHAPIRDRLSKIAVIGSGPAGLTAAFRLARGGYDVTVFEKESLPGGNLRHPELRERLPLDVLDREINTLLSIGIDLRTNTTIKQSDLTLLAEEFQAIILANGEGLDAVAPHIIPAKAGTSLAIQAIARGKDAAIRADQFLRGLEPTGEKRRFNSRFGKLLEPEFSVYLKESTTQTRLEPKTLPGGLTGEQVKAEAARCMHCDCRKKDQCKLRDFSDAFSASQRRFSYGERKLITKEIQKDLVIYEPAKCIKCGICVRLTEKYQERYGFTFIGRGFDVEIQVPFSESLEQGLSHTAIEVAEACPTGAISPIKSNKT